jgi:hypothetical protein
LTIGARVLITRKLTPWRFIVFEGDAASAPARSHREGVRAKNPQATAADIEVESAG